MPHFVAGNCLVILLILKLPTSRTLRGPHAAWWLAALVGHPAKELDVEEKHYQNISKKSFRKEKNTLVSWFEVCKSFLKLVLYHKNIIHSLNQYMLSWLSLSFQAESIRYPEMRPAGYAFWVPGNPGTWTARWFWRDYSCNFRGTNNTESHTEFQVLIYVYIYIHHCMYISCIRYPFVSFSYLKIIKVSNDYDGNDSIWQGNTLPEMYSREI